MSFRQIRVKRPGACGLCTDGTPSVVAVPARSKGWASPLTRFRVRRTNVRAQAGSFTDLITAFALGALTSGFRPDHILVAEYQLPLNQHPSSASVDLFNH